MFTNDNTTQENLITEKVKNDDQHQINYQKMQERLKREKILALRQHNIELQKEERKK